MTQGGCFGSSSRPLPLRCCRRRQPPLQLLSALTSSPYLFHTPFLSCWSAQRWLITMSAMGLRWKSKGRWGRGRAAHTHKQVSLGNHTSPMLPMVGRQAQQLVPAGSAGTAGAWRRPPT